MFSYESWFEKFGDDVISRMEEWFDNCPFPIARREYEALIDIALEIEYDSFIGDYEDYMYEQYRESLLLDEGV